MPAKIGMVSQMKANDVKVRQAIYRIQCSTRYNGASPQILHAHTTLIQFTTF